MKRREAVQYISLLLGGTIIGANYFLEGCKSKTGISTDFTPEILHSSMKWQILFYPLLKLPVPKLPKWDSL